MPSPSPDRHHRQRILPFIGEAGQRAVASAHVVLVGVGALGCQAADLLVRAGVGTVTLIDRDVVELTNLQRQTLFAEADAVARLPKVQAAASRLAAIDASVTVRTVAADFSSRNAASILEEARAASPVTLLLDGTDNFETRYLINDLSVHARVPSIYAGVIASRAMAMALRSGENAPCLRCVFPEPPAPGSQPTCDTAGVLGAAVAVAASWQVALAMRVIVGETPEPVLHDGDLWSGSWRSIRVSRDPACPCCGAGGRPEFLEAPASHATHLCGSDSVQVWPGDARRRLDLAAIAERLRAGGVVSHTSFMLRFAPASETIELSLFSDGRAIIRGTRDVAAARSAYAKYVGM
jgi:adenylyltransferase/sulfurtransferase